jgi:hypothetical protein
MNSWKTGIDRLVAAVTMIGRRDGFCSYGNENWEFDHNGSMRLWLPSSMIGRLSSWSASIIGPFDP